MDIAALSMGMSQMNLHQQASMSVSRYTHRVFSQNPNEKDVNRLKELIKKHEVNGNVTINIERKNAIIYFEK